MLRKVNVFISRKYFVVVFLITYLALTCFAAYKLYHNDRRSQHNKGLLKETDSYPQSESVSPRRVIQKSRLIPSLPTIEVWGKAAIGEYLWKHILGGELTDKDNSWYSYGSLNVNNMSFIFRSGPGVAPNTVPQNVQFLVLVINGRSESKISAAKIWLDSLPSFRYLRNVIIIVLGDEKCDNDWLLPYMKSRGGKVNAAFLVYDSPLVDNREFFQWPLGVATYRGFPNLQDEDVDLLSSRPYLCNFLGTVYKNSSRETLIETIKLNNLEDECLILGRPRWSPLETKLTFGRYISSIHKSDLTLNPVGMNTECYRIYESLSLGSIPVVEDVVTTGNCDRNNFQSPLRLLKDHGAPLIFIKNWSDLPLLLSEERMLTLEEKVQRRVFAMQWYKNFKTTMRNILIETIYKALEMK